MASFEQMDANQAGNARLSDRSRQDGVVSREEFMFGMMARVSSLRSAWVTSKETATDLSVMSVYMGSRCTSRC